MPKLQPLTPHQAVAFIEKAGVVDADRLILDYAATGHLRAQALIIETATAAGERIDQHASIPKDLWKRIIREGVQADVWPGGTVRLPGSDAVDGPPAVNLTCIRFEVLDLFKLIRSQGAAFPAMTAETTVTPALPEQVPAPEQETTALTPALAKGRKRRSADMSAIPAGALLISVGDMMAALGIGRTKAYELINSGKVERREVDGAPRITVASVKALAGVAD